SGISRSLWPSSRRAARKPRAGWRKPTTSWRAGAAVSFSTPAKSFRSALPTGCISTPPRTVSWAQRSERPWKGSSGSRDFRFPSEGFGDSREELPGVVARRRLDPGILGRAAEPTSRPEHPARPVLRRDRIEEAALLVEPLQPRIQSEDPGSGEPHADQA